MSWQGNECFVGYVEYKSITDDGEIMDAMKELLRLYDEKGNGWYLLGNIDSDAEQDDVDPFELTNENHGCGWFENPFMPSEVIALNVRKPSDLIETAFECWDCNCDYLAYAGDGDKPLEHLVIYGEEYNWWEGR